MITRKHLLIGLIIANSWLLPTIVGYLSQQPPDAIFLGWIRSDDYHRYGSFIEQTAREGRFLYEDHSTTDIQSPKMIAIYFTVLGFMARWFRLPSEVTWQISYVIVSLCFLIILKRFLENTFRDRKTQLLAFYLVLCGSGLEWLMTLTGIDVPRPRNFWMDGFSTFTSFHNPLKIAGVALTILMVDGASRLMESSRWPKYVAWLSVLILLNWMVHPNSAIVAYAAVSCIIFIPLRETDVADASASTGWRETWRRSGFLLVPYLIVVGYVQWMQTDPMTANIIRQYHVPHSSEPLWSYPIRYSWVLLFGIWGLFTAVRQGPIRLRLLVGWIAGALFFSLYPGMTGLLFQHMIHFPLAILAAQPLKKMMSGFASPIPGILISIIVLGTGAVNDLYALTKASIQTREDVWPTSLYASESELEMMRILSGLPRGNVLVNRDTGNKIGWRALQNVYLGHWGTTPQKGEKENKLKRFYDPTVDSADKLDLLKQYHIRYIWYGPREMALGPIPELPDCTLVRSIGNISLYEVLHRVEPTDGQRIQRPDHETAPGLR